MEDLPSQKIGRIPVVDALRGFAIVAIMLLHNIEHFDVYFQPEHLPQWMESLDKVIWGTLFFLFAGKAYSIFAILFGLTYHIQTQNQKVRGNDFRSRFVWRMLLLFGFGIINSAFFQGDILTLYAVIGLLLIPFTKLNDKVILTAVAILFLVPNALIALFVRINNPGMEMQDPASWQYFGQMWEYIDKPNFFATLKGNLTIGKKAVLLWNWENGRVFMLLALFLLGYLLGRNNRFQWNQKNALFWKKVLRVSGITFIPLFVISRNLELIPDSEAIIRPLHTIINTWNNTAFTFIIISGFILLFHLTRMKNTLQYFSWFGKMSLSNYVFQSIIGALIYHGYGLAMFKYTGATYSFLIAIGVTMIMGIFCKWWLMKYKRGPLETIWHSLTWINSSKN